MSPTTSTTTTTPTTAIPSTNAHNRLERRNYGSITSQNSSTDTLIMYSEGEEGSASEYESDCLSCCSDHQLNINDQSHEILCNAKTSGSESDNPKPNTNIFRKDLYHLLSLASPLALSNLLQFLISSTCILSIGHYDPNHLPALSLALLLFNLTGSCLAQGVAGALETVLSKGDNSVGRHLNRALILSVLVSTVVSFCWIYLTEPLLLLLGQDLSVSKGAATFISLLTPGLYALFITECLKRYLASLNTTTPIFISTVTGSIMCVAGQYLFVWSGVGGFEVYGASVAMSCTYIIMSIIQTSYILSTPTTRIPLSPPSSRSIPTLHFTSLAIHNSIMVFSEWIAFEAISLSAGVLGPRYLAAQTILIHIDSILFMIPMGIGGAATLVVGKWMARGDARRAWSVAGIAYLCVLGPAFVNSGVLIGARKWVGFIVTSDPEVIEIVEMLVPFIAYNQIVDSVSVITASVLRALGHQKIGAGVSAIGYAVVAIPLGLYLCFPLNMGMEGLWIGVASGLTIVCICGGCWLLTADWESIVVEIKAREYGENDFDGRLQDIENQVEFEGLLDSYDHRVCEI